MNSNFSQPEGGAQNNIHSLGGLTAESSQKIALFGGVGSCALPRNAWCVACFWSGGGTLFGVLISAILSCGIYVEASLARIGPKCKCSGSCK